MNELSLNQLAWLLGLATAKRRKREKETPFRKPHQSPEEFADFMARRDASLLFARQTEDTLIRIVGEADPGLLREEHRARFAEIASKAEIGNHTLAAARELGWTHVPDPSC